MGTIRRVLECGHVQRMDSLKYDDLVEELGHDLRVMRCMKCEGEIRKVTGVVARQEAVAATEPE